MATAADIVRSALERIGVVPIGETVPTEHRSEERRVGKECRL